MLLLALPTDAHATDGLYISARGAPSAGMGGATIASGSDPIAQTLNPASLAVTPPGLAVDLLYLNTQIRFRNQGVYGPGVAGLEGQSFHNDALNAQDLEYFPFQDNQLLVPMLGVVARASSSDERLGAIPLRDLTLGLSFYGAGGDAVRFHLDDPVTGPDTLFRSNLAVSVSGLSLAWAVNDRISLGATFQLVGSRLRIAQPMSFDVADFTQGTTPFLQEPFFDVGNFAGLFSRLGAQEGTSFTKFSHDGLALGAGGRFGVRIQPVPWLTLGAAYQLRRTMKFDGHAKLDFKPQIDEAAGLVVENPLADPLIDVVQAATVAAYGDLTGPNVVRALFLVGLDPDLGFEQTYDAKIPFSLPQQLNVGAAVRLLPRWLVELDYTWIDWSRALDALRIRFRNGSNANLNTIAGSDQIDFSVPLRWKDQHVVAVGTSVAVNSDLRVRLGYRWASDPVRPEGHVLTIPVAGSHAMSLGAGLHLTDSVDLDLSFEHVFPSTLRVGRSDVSSFQANSSERTSEYSAQAQISVRLGSAPEPPGPPAGMVGTSGPRRRPRDAAARFR